MSEGNANAERHTPNADPTVADLGERALIDRIRARLPADPKWVVAGIGDDAAVVEPERNRLMVVTTDALVEGVHFNRGFGPVEAIGHKALAVNLSDLAAMGAEPRGALLSLALPPTLAVAEVDGLLDGLVALAGRWHVTLVGGNIARSPGPLVVDLTAFGSVARRRVLTRSGARPGDVVYVSGQVGAAAAGLDWCRLEARDRLAVESAAGAADPDETSAWMAGCRDRFLRPEPRVRLGLLLGRNQAATACIDLSDGLADGLRQLAAASGVGIAIDGEAVPVDAAASRWFEARGRDPLDAALTGGEDYEMLFTASRRRRRGALVHVQRGVSGLPLTAIGVVTADRALVVRRRGEEGDLPAGFAHFR